MLKRTVFISGHSTSVSLEDEFWTALKDLCKQDDKSINQLITEIDNERLKTSNLNLSSAIRIYILQHSNTK